MKIQKKCQTCGCTFEVPHWRPNAKYCSPVCRQQGLKGVPNAVCPSCGKSFHVKQSHLSRYKGEWGFCCSKKCAAHIKSLRMSGNGNHQYGLKGGLNSSFKGEITKTKNHRYVDLRIYVPTHPYADKSGRVLLHRYIVEQNYNLFNEKWFDFLDGKPYLKKSAVVHHIDGNHANNDLCNLCVTSKGIHTSIHNSQYYMVKDKRTKRYVARVPLPIRDIEFIEVDELSDTNRSACSYGSSDECDI